MQQLSFFDSCIVSFDQLLQSLGGRQGQPTRENPAKEVPESALNFTEKQNLIGLMRINHTGEVCAQALYQGQALTARDKNLHEKLKEAAQEEIDHLHWCEQRLQELGGRTSFLNPLWYLGSLTMGIAAGLTGDRWNLGFLAETENQVSTHLSEHLERIPKQDQKSRKILETMHADEIKHATTAMDNGAYQLPELFKRLMRFSAKIMTSTTYYI
jgi:ubiquinone biosynthesis monooxygenase Coq7